VATSTETSTDTERDEDGYETVIGLEVHVELATATKLFCSCRNEFGAEPNTNICPVCLGLPGSLPVLNEHAVELALRLGEALECDVPEQSTFARKNYFYPDMPKDYQVSQYDEPICVRGQLDVDGSRIGVTRAHLEEDTGKTVHVGGSGRLHEAAHSLVDYNRAGVPLLEIVSEPDMRSAEQARAYVEELRSTLKALGVSDVKMEEGSLRVDANVSIRRRGSAELGTKIEIKNMNSLRSLQRAIEFERSRQIAALDAGERLTQETRHWDESAGVTHGSRSKEESHDYRYFPEPDLVPVAPTDELRERVRRTMPELPAARRARLVAAWGVGEDEINLLAATDGLLEWTAQVIEAGAEPKAAINWVGTDVLARLHEAGVAPAELPLPPDGLAELIALVADGTISRGQAKDVLGDVLRDGRRPREIVAERGLEQVSDESALAAVLDAVLADNADAVAEYRSGDDKARKKKRGFLMGEAMKALRGEGNPQVLNRLLDERLQS
jgi:aspartyl-tRNA(Asn)/glutamyl-tRNA(Gln) amidotransferase subunit B